MFSLKKKILFLVSLVVFAAFGTSWLLLHGVVRNGIIKQGALELSRQTELLSLSLAREGVPGFLRDLERWRGALHGRVTLIDTSGAVLADTERNPSAMDNHLSRPEVQEALSSGEGEAVRYSRTTNTYSLYFARRVPWRAAGQHQYGPPIHLTTSHPSPGKYGTGSFSTFCSPSSLSLASEHGLSVSSFVPSNGW